MEIKISPTTDQDSGKQKHIRKKSQKDPLPMIIVRTLICIAVIDSIIWGYFAFVKKVTLIEGLKGWTTDVQKFVGYDTTRKPNFINKTVIVNKPRQLQKDNVARSTINQRPTSTPPKYLNTDDAIHDIEVKNKVIGRGSNIMYSWKDENGTINYSNTGFPEGNIEKLWVRKMPGN